MSDFIKEMEQRELVQQQISLVPKVKMKYDMAMIPCPFHSDINPSCAVYFKSSQSHPGSWYCFGCGAHGLWNELAEALGLEQFDSKPKDRYTRPVSVTLEDYSSDEKLVFKSLPKNKTWRGISTDLLIDVGCKLCKVKYSSGQISDSFIYMPVNINGQTEGYIKARLKKDPNKPSYINKKGNWAKSKGLFPFDYSISKMTSHKAMVLVEGQRDALRLLQNGIPALCIMGTHNWNDEKSMLLEIHGVKKAIIFLDGDDAGISGTKLLYPSLKKYIPNVQVIKLWSWPDSPYLKYRDKKEALAHGLEHWDPFNCPQEILDEIKELV